jgi:hypothetical protein
MCPVEAKVFEADPSSVNANGAYSIVRNGSNVIGSHASSSNSVHHRDAFFVEFVDSFLTPSRPSPFPFVSVASSSFAPRRAAAAAAAATASFPPNLCPLDACVFLVPNPAPRRRCLRCAATAGLSSPPPPPVVVGGGGGASSVDIAFRTVSSP